MTVRKMSTVWVMIVVKEFLNSILCWLKGERLHFSLFLSMLIKVVNTNVVCLVRSLAHVCIGGIICYFLFWLALIYVARAAAQ